jgi:hypothetical protein
MLTNFFGALFLGIAATSFAAAPALDNERVTVWDAKGVMPPAENDFVAVSLSHLGTAEFGHRGDTPGKPGVRTVIIELKGDAAGPIPNKSGYPLAFPRLRAKKLFENAKVIVWDYAWRVHEPTPMHFHDKDALVVFEADGPLQSTTPDGKSVANDYHFGDIRFNRGDRTHTEVLLHGQQHAVITELK